MYTLHEQMAQKLAEAVAPGGRFAFSSRMSHTYRSVIEYLDGEPAYAAYRATYNTWNRPRPQDTGDVSAAGQFHYYFPTHVFKFQKAVLDSLVAKVHVPECSPLGASDVTIIDIAAGPGTAALSIVDMLASWTELCHEAGHSTQRAKVRILAVDNDASKTRIREMAWRAYEETIPNAFLEIEHLPPVTESFPEDECIDRILASLSSGQLVLTCVSNAVTWLRGFHLTFLDRLARRIGRTAKAKVPPYAAAFNDLLARLPFGLKMVLLSETTGDGRDDDLRYLRDYLGRSDGHTSILREFQDMHVDYCNPAESPWGRRNHQSDYHYVRITLDAGYTDEQLRRAADVKACELSWFKSRYETYRGPLMDEVACKLVEADFGWHMERLSRGFICAGSQQWPEVSTPFFRQPKPSGGHRMTMVGSVLDGAYAIALLSAIAGAVKKRTKYCSYAYRLTNDHTEFLYEYFGNAYRRYVTAIKSCLSRHGSFTSVDISSFYASIIQEQMRDRLFSYVDGACRITRQRWTAHLSRCIPGSNGGCGLPVNHPVSGVLSNLYLGLLDTHMTSSGMKCRHNGYFRYVDDMTLACSPEESDSLVGQVENELADGRYGLSLNTAKTISGDCASFLARTEDPELEKLARYVRAILSRAYTLPVGWRRAYDADPAEFSAWYSEILRRAGICVSARHLLRKLHTTRYRLPIGSRAPLDWSSLGTPVTSQHNDWVVQFSYDNDAWYDRKYRVSGELFAIADDSLREVARCASGSLEERVHQRRLRFSVYRLVLLQHKNVIPVLASLLEVPRLVSPAVVAMGLAYFRELRMLREALRSPDDMVRLGCMRYLGELRDHTSVPMLWEFTEADRTQAERLCASEALMRIDDWNAESRELLLDRSNTEDDPYVAKNYMVLLAYVKPDGWEEAMGSLLRRVHHQIVCDAYVYSSKGISVNLLQQAEIAPPYGRAYPDEDFGNLDVSGY